MHRWFAAPVVGRTSVFALERELFVCDDFVRRHELASREARRTLERRGAAEVPDALEIRMAVRRPRQWRFLLSVDVERGEDESRGGDQTGNSHNGDSLHLLPSPGPGRDRRKPAPP